MVTGNKVLYKPTQGGADISSDFIGAITEAQNGCHPLRHAKNRRRPPSCETASPFYTSRNKLQPPTLQMAVIKSELYQPLTVRGSHFATEIFSQSDYTVCGLS